MQRKISYASARNKGKTFERNISKQLKSIGIEAQRVPMSGALAFMKGDVIELSGIRKHVHECKHQEALSINTWWGQALDQVKDDEIPVLHFTSNYKPVYTMITSELFDEMVYAYHQLHRELNLRITDYPPRKNFWKFIEKETTKHVAYLTNDRVIIPLETYLLLRKASISSL